MRGAEGLFDMATIGTCARANLACGVVANCNGGRAAQPAVAIARPATGNRRREYVSKQYAATGSRHFDNERTLMAIIHRRGPAAVAAALFLLAGSGAIAHGPQGGHHGRHHGGGIEQAIAKVKDNLALNSSQQLMWDNAVAATKSARQAGRDERQRVHAAVSAELAKAEPDLAALAALSDQAQERGHALRRQVRDEWLKLYATFTPEQKLVVRDQLAKRVERFERFREHMHGRFGNRG
jgi:Spy/CpxP family protein refolding chaperone